MGPSTATGSITAEIDPAFADLPIARERIDDVALETVMSNGFGFGGTNATIIMRRYDG